MDISRMLSGWAHDPDRVSVRIVKGDDGKEKIQLRLDLGLLQMEFEGRPDGQIVEDCPSWLDFYQKKQKAHDAEYPDGAPFQLESEDCMLLLREGVQYYHRYISFWHLERYELCARDTNRNLRLFKFVREFARHHRDKLQFDQWRPYVTMMHARAVAMPFVELEDYRAAIGAIDAGIASIRRFLDEYGQSQNAESCNELSHLLRLRDELAAKTSGALEELPVDPMSALREQLARAVSEERFEEAAQLRDQIRQQSPGRGSGGDEGL